MPDEEKGMMRLPFRKVLAYLDTIIALRRENRRLREALHEAKEDKTMPETSNPDDLTDLAKDLEAVFKDYFGAKPAMAIAFTLPPDYQEVHWVTNVERSDGITLFRNTAKKMIRQTN